MIPWSDYEAARQDAAIRQYEAAQQAAVSRQPPYGYPYAGPYAYVGQEPVSPQANPWMPIATMWDSDAADYLMQCMRKLADNGVQGGTIISILRVFADTFSADDF